MAPTHRDGGRSSARATKRRTDGERSDREGPLHADQTKVVEVGRGVLARVGEIVRDSMDVGEASVLVVADERTWTAAGEAADASLRAAGLRVEDALIFPGTPALYAAYEHCETIRERLRETGSLGVAVGAGTLNDLVKLASGELEQPYTPARHRGLDGRLHRLRRPDDPRRREGDHSARHRRWRSRPS